MNEYWPEFNGLTGPQPEGRIAVHNLVDLYGELAVKMLLIDYHYNYWSLKEEIERLRGRVYELEQMQDSETTYDHGGFTDPF